MSRITLLGFAFSAVVATGCYDTPQPQCAFLCGAADACPDGYSCATDGWCKRDGVPDNFVCEGPGVIDAAVADAATIDAAPDIDADPNAPDAGPDAATPDAAPDPDGPPAPIDAAPDIDAVPPPVDATPDLDGPSAAVGAAMVDGMPSMT